MKERTLKVEQSKNKYPYCIVWTPLPLITALIPFIGHTGVCTSDGTIHDFAGPYTISVDDMAFGNPTKYVQLPISDENSWNESVKAGDQKFRKMTHNLVFNNCHSHVAYVLNQAGYKNGGWNMVSVAILFMTQGKYTSFTSFIKTYIGFIILVSAIALFYYGK